MVDIKLCCYDHSAVLIWSSKPRPSPVKFFQDGGRGGKVGRFLAGKSGSRFFLSVKQGMGGGVAFSNL